MLSTYGKLHWIVTASLGNEESLWSGGWSKPAFRWPPNDMCTHVQTETWTEQKCEVTKVLLTSIHSKWKEEEAVLIMKGIPWVEITCLQPSKCPVTCSRVTTRLDTSGFWGHRNRQKPHEITSKWTHVGKSLNQREPSWLLPEVDPHIPPASFHLPLHRILASVSVH